MNEITITRSASFPDPLRIGRYKSNPDLGPRLLFFSGGTALNGVAQTLKSYTHNSIHLVTPFDSGGSSQVLRKTFDMPAIGDLRSRMMALADESVLGHPEILRLFTHRFKSNTEKETLNTELSAMVNGSHPLVTAIEKPMRTLVMHQLSVFEDARPPLFDLRGASIGNLILAGGYLNQNEELEPILFLFSKLVGVQGIVRSIVDDKLHLGADLKNGQTIIGQHLLTGKDHQPITSPISHLYLNADAEVHAPVAIKLGNRNRNLISSADLICYPPGSFYTSVVANLLPEGVGQEISKRNVPKVFIPSLGHDPETKSTETENMTVTQRVQKLLSYLKQDAGFDCSNDQLVNFVLLDRNTYEDEHRMFQDKAELEKLGVTVIQLDLTNSSSKSFYDPAAICEALLSFT